MQRENRYDEFNNDDPAWCVIAEYSLGKGMFGEELQAGLMLGSLYKSLRDLGIQPGYLNKLEETITGIAAGVNRRSPGDPDYPVLIRLLCQSIRVDSLTRLENYRNGGWGYYLIEREAESPDIPYKERPRVVELYLYKEGK